ncbi:uncharacterized protein LOC119997800 isoform X2 [Tripterygium wilfordii]|uniref:uncharacterized protein LOC119997800 isoform X2 n=1 Tax=Tripterygium wilfordii TaxID=458696 RepID=UPI0018F84636|nr:uncharacterized protein LOC119997800 isoform X2 [Tripterygium wilfordii]
MDALDIADLSKAVQGENLSNILEDNIAAGRTESWMWKQISQDEIQPTRIERKRLSDKAYRDRRKEGKKKMQDELHKHTVENKHAKQENQLLKNEIDSMNLKLQSAAMEIEQLQNLICELRRQNGCQQVLMEAFLHKIVSFSLFQLLHFSATFSYNMSLTILSVLISYEIVHMQVGPKDRDPQLGKLQHEIRVLRRTVAFTGWMEEAMQLLNRIAELQHQNKDLKVQVQALCEKIYNDKLNS